MLQLLVVWGIVYGAVYRAATGRNGRAFAILAALVVSHWILDFIVHRPDLPLYPGSPKFGLGLWNSVAGTMLVEIAMYAVSLWIYAQATRARDGVGRWGFISFAVFLLISYLFTSIGPPPPSVRAIWTVGLVAGVISVLWSEWFDRHRGQA